MRFFNCVYSDYWRVDDCCFVTGFDKGMHIIGAVVIGAVISLPVALFVTKRLTQLTSGSNKAPKSLINFKNIRLPILSKAS